MRGLMTAVGAAALVCAAAAGCGSDAPTVARADLEKDITTRLSGAGKPPQSVACRADLEGVVGNTTTCEVVISETNAIEPVVAVTEVKDTTVSYEMTPALSQAQLEKSVAELVSGSVGEDPTGVTCSGGLKGEQGTTVDCSMQLDGEPLDTVVTVTTVDGLLMNFEVNQA
ncbi:DUF4333 domain-containing protein [Mycolicibacterium mengxianglii]|uniref:DUF4333 domain-containing protein n=1 Tax=Mycolicibacterium mengxianglii TaxID=2736649 RepID=UPI0018D031A9|nr:DUF4333 domain-containing protein [Mycolicibacterium mengxianglii]